MIGMLPVGRVPGDAQRLMALFWSLRVKDRAIRRSNAYAAGTEHHLRQAKSHTGPDLRRLRLSGNMCEPSGWQRQGVRLQPAHPQRKP